MLAPLRMEIFGAERLRQHGSSLGGSHRVRRSGSGGGSFHPRLHSNIRALHTAYAYLASRAREGLDQGPVAAWMLDNFHLVQAQMAAIREGLPGRFYRSLPVLADAPLTGLPRIYDVAWAFVVHTDSAFDESLLLTYLNAYQDERELGHGELWALPTTLRIVLLENLRRLAERTVAHLAAVELATACEQNLSRLTPGGIRSLADRLAGRGVGVTFRMGLLQHLGGHRWVDDERVAAVRAWLAGSLPEPDALRAQQDAEQAADLLSVSNAVSALRHIGSADWTDLVARSSRVVAVLMDSPVFAAEDQPTRNTTLHGIERLAALARQTESAVARRLLQAMAHASGGSEDPRRLASHWLHGEGQADLRRALGLSRTLGSWWRFLPHPSKTQLYLGTIALATVALVLGWLDAWGRPGPAALTVLVIGLMAWPASEIVVSVVNRLIGESVKPAHLPRLELADGLPAHAQVMVAMPALLGDAGTVSALVHRLHLHHLANPERHAQFALLTDWNDADRETLPGDGALLEQAMAGVAALNAEHPVPAGEAPRFLLLHRARAWCHTEQRWIGHERKRGKLEALVALLATGDAGPLLPLPAGACVAPGTRYVLTLDSDTWLPPGRLRSLVGVAEHPANRPVLDPHTGRVCRGVGIVQPRLVAPLPGRHTRCAWQWMGLARQGLDPYSAMASDLYQDLWGEGSFTGKGLLHVATVHAVLGGRLPKDSVLSHDLLEGALARCAVVSDIVLIEPEPAHADAASARLHRWVRGDWQLLPFLLAPRDWPMAGINRWKLADNLRRSLVAPASLVLLVLAMGGHGLTLPAALLLVLLAGGSGPVMGALAASVPPGLDRLNTRFLWLAVADLWRALVATLWGLSQLPAQGLSNADAVLRTLHRLLVSRRHLLAWSTSASQQQGMGTGLRPTLMRHRVSWAGWLATAALLWFSAAGHGSWRLSLAVGGLWTVAPLLLWLFHRPLAPRPDLRPDDRRYLSDLARDTWRLFERTVNQHSHHLPPDNLQVLPHEQIAERTSPTNIGLYLLSTACARSFGWIDTRDMVERLEATLATLQKMERHRGHFLNWYDTETLRPLPPRYVSTVDSGNLGAHLLAVAQACLERAAEPTGDMAADALGARLRALALRCQALASEAEFGFLLHPRRRLFHIGYRVDDGVLDPALYDLLASEARTTSLLAIGKGDVPARHWSALGRPCFAAGRHAVLRSWSGSMFEYLMPLLVSEPPAGSALDDAAVSAVREQRAFARTLGIPWGMSECAHAERDEALAYQYAPQGVPRLAFRHPPSAECVVAPYASVLAAQVDAAAACDNLRALAKLGARARYGFIEALDYSPARQVHGTPFTLVGTFMAHHQGMSVVALANVLLGGVAQRWGMAEPRLQALYALLHEQSPRAMAAASPSPLVVLPDGPRGAPHSRSVAPGSQPIEPTHLSGNGRYTVSLRPNGAGWSRWGPIGLSRWRDDALRDEHGSFIYLRTEPDSVPVSLTSHPAPDPAARYGCEFHADRVCFSADWPGLHAQTTVWVSPEDDIELRKVVLINRGPEAITIELISALDITLTEPAADEAHPAFSNLFVDARWVPAQHALCFERRPRRDGEPSALAAHFVAHVQGDWLQAGCQTDRLHWRGRLHPASHPLARLMPVAEGPGPLDTGLDPVAVLGLTLRIPAGGQAAVVFATAASDAPSTLSAVIDKYREPGYVERSSVMSATLAAIATPPRRPHSDHLPAMQWLTTALLFTLRALQTRATEGVPIDRRAIWSLGLSGDRPVLLVDGATRQGLGLLRMVALMRREWLRAGVACDLVVLSLEAHSYDMPLQRELNRLREQQQADPHTADARFGQLRAWRIDELTPVQLASLRALARVTLIADGVPLLHQVRAWCQAQGVDRSGHAGARLAVPVSLLAKPAQAAVGRFGPEGRAFHIDLDNAHQTPRPWINVLANPGFGALLTESGAGNTWGRNSRLEQITPWANDPVADPPSEWFWLHDRQRDQAWSLAPSAWAPARARHRVTHTQGLTTVAHEVDGLRVAVHWCVDAVTAIKQIRVTVTNTGPRKRHLRLVAMVEWLLGEKRADRATLHTRAVPASGTADDPAAPVLGLLCTQRRLGLEADRASGGVTAFLAEVPHAANDGASHGQGSDWTCDRRAFFDAAGRIVVPRALGRVAGSGLDPCAALARLVTLRPGVTLQQTYLIGFAEHPEAASQLLRAAGAVDPLERERAVRARWARLSAAVDVKTPDPLFDALVNHWLPYQLVSSRLCAKAGFYQAGGATGFRDQLQDCMALTWAEPGLLRAQIVRCASRQFDAGDVQHWWHEPGGAGVRTHFSDDLLWLPFACGHYLRATGDVAVLDEPVPFLEAPDLPPDREDAYDTPQVSRRMASVYEHAARAIDRSLRTGVHGLPLMGTGDWNDGMNRVGHGGRGESVWLAWFLCAITAQWVPLARQRGETARARRWAEARAGWVQALETHGWDGAWYRRAFFDDGSPLGAAQRPEARIDLIAQAWAVLSAQAPLDRQRQAMAATRSELHDASAGLMRLLTPPLRQAVPGAGYIQAYPPGVRENGGQYAHAAVWALMANARLAQRDGRGPDPAASDTVYADFCELSPAHRAAHPVWGDRYGLEPYAMAADVCSEAPWRGRGGWSWYTGAAGWLHRAAIGSLFGLQMTHDELWFDPCLPTAWHDVTLTLRRGPRRMAFRLHRQALVQDVPGVGLLQGGQRLRWRELAPDTQWSLRLP